MRSAGTIPVAADRRALGAYSTRKHGEQKHLSKYPHMGVGAVLARAAARAHGAPTWRLRVPRASRDVYHGLSTDGRTSKHLGL